MDHIILPQVKEHSVDKNTSEFVISPLFPGYGHTVGNGLRRVLLSSLPGAAVTAIKIDDVNHEFSTIPGVKEDVVEFILNLKMLRVKMHDTAEPVVLNLQAKGPGIVTAKDFKANAKVEITNPELHLATLGAKATLSAEVTVEYGRGFDPIEKRENRSKDLGTIVVDSLFTPVYAVSLEVENTRVGKMTNYDQLHLAITTDGSITPSEALKAASAILVDQFQLLSTFDHPSTSEVVKEELPQLDQSELASTGLSPRIITILSQNNITTIDAVKNISDEDLHNVSGLGPKALSEISKIKETL